MTAATDIARRARSAARVAAAAPTARKNAALQRFAALLWAQRAGIIAANTADTAAAEHNQVDAAKRERLVLGEDRLAAAIRGIEQIIALPDPIGQIDDWRFQPSGIRVGKMRIPLGVILMIYESRPNITADAAALCLKAGNAVILRGGSEAQQSNAAIGNCLQTALREHGLDDAAQIICDGGRQRVQELLRLSDDIDVVIPRGGRGLIEQVTKDSNIPVIKHLDGNCHIFVDETADIKMAVAVADNAKNRRYGVCNAAESLLLHRACAATHLPQIAAKFADKKVEMRVCGESKKILHAAGITAGVVDAGDDDWAREYLAPIISVRIVGSVDEAIAHINTHGSGHTDAILTERSENAWRFLAQVDSSSVMVNASTAFADGFEYGLGAEIGISTDKLHARGPVGVMGLTGQKYIVMGDGNCRP